MRLRIRGPSGQVAVTLSDEATIKDLRDKIAETTSISNFDIKYGYPPRTLEIEELGENNSLSSLKLDGEQLIVSEKLSPKKSEAAQQTKGTGLNAVPIDPQRTTIGSNKLPKTEAPLSLERKAPPSDPPELPLPSHSCTILLRIMPDDNSCLFRAFNSAYFGAMDNMHELRSVIAQTIQSNTDTYSAAVLDKEPDSYCKWIQRADAWGGSIELQILSTHFEVEICSIDVQTLRVDRYNEGKSKRCILVYSGIHYDVVGLSPSDPPYDKSHAPPEFDEKVFDASDEEVVQKAVDLCRILRARGYYTDTANFRVKCLDCGKMLIGEQGALEHATETGHSNFGEA